MPEVHQEEENNDSDDDEEEAVEIRQGDEHGVDIEDQGENSSIHKNSNKNSNKVATSNSTRRLEDMGDLKKNVVAQFIADDGPHTYEDGNFHTENYVTYLQEESSPNRKARLSLPPIQY